MWKATITYQGRADLVAEETIEAAKILCKNGPQGTIAIDGDEEKTFIVPADRVISIIIDKTSNSE